MIYLVEDDQSIRELMIYTLKASNYEAKGFSKGNEMFNEIKKERPDLIMLDIMLENEDGITILKKLKSDLSLKDIPIIMATAKGSEYDKVIALDLGADDYLTKPFGMMEMVSRVRAVLRRYKNENSNDILKFKEIEVDKRKHRATVNGQNINLTYKEFELLVLFMENLERAFKRDELLSMIWRDSYYETRTVDVHIGTLRTKLLDCGKYITTVRNIGYKMGKDYD